MAVAKYLSITFFAFFLFSLTSASWKRNQVTLQDGGYIDLLIAINKNEIEDSALIDNIKEIFTKGSSFLFEATDHRVYWKNITILVPQSWTHRTEYKPAKTETFDRANVLIDWGASKSPYVHAIEGCGKQGQYINLTPQYVRNKQYAEDGWGPRDKTIVHEWAHLRWGVFDEYPYKDDPHFFVSKKQIEATRCSKLVTGVYEDNKGGNCIVDPETGVYTDSCQFIDDNAYGTARTSIMYKQFLPTISFFCSRNEIDPYKRHFEEAPNRQNDFCGGEGVWDVILQTDDFKDGKNPPLEKSVDTTPTFRIVQTTTRRVVLVLDASGSMEGDPLSHLRQATIQYLGYTVDIGSYVGIVEFSTNGRQLAPLTLVADDGSREALIAALPSSADGKTSIGSGVLKGIELLSSGQSSDGGYLLVISDGKNNESPDIDDVLDDVITSGVIVDTIAFTDNADNALANLSTISGGSAYFYSGSESITSLIDSLKATITDRPDQTNQILPITLYSEALSIDNTTGTVTSYVTIDTSVGVDTVFSFVWLDYPIEVALQSPDGQSFNKTSEEYELNSGDEIITILISGRAVAGSWNFLISNQFSSYPSHIVTVTVESKQASADDTPITLSSFVSEPSINYQTTPYIIIFAFVKKGNESVANADVISILERPNAPDDIIQLYDSGTNADIAKYDGVYSAYFFNFTGNGRYNVDVKVRGNEDTSSIGKAENSGSFPIQGEEETIMKPIDMFERSASGGALQVSNHVEGTTDFLQPSRIVDLRLAKVSYQDQSATLKWTAVGDDFDKGTVSEYDLRFAETFQEISRNFSDATRVTSDDVINGDLLTIKQPGNLEEVSIRLPNRGDEVSYFFGIMAVDEANNTGGVSNIVSANLEYIPPLEPDSEPASIVVWIVVAVGVAGVLMIGLIIIYLYKRRSTNGSNGSAMGHVNPTYA